MWDFFRRIGSSAKFKELFGIDIRSLALFRIGIAIIILHDLFIRSQDILAHYSDFGLLPRDVLIGSISDMWHVSVHLANGTPEFQSLLFFVAALCALALLVGYKTRLSTIFSWILLISLHARNPLVLQGGDGVLRVLLFWSMFLPLGSCWSVDAWLRNRPALSNQYTSVASLGLLLQVCFIYWFSALLKTDDSWRVDGTAVWYALSLELFSTSFGKMLLDYPQLLKGLTFATFYLEALGPFFAFSPIYTGPLRMATAVVFMGFHLIGLNLTMELGHFVYICAVAWIVFIPEWFWNHIFKKTKGETRWQGSYFSNILAIFFITCIFSWNVATLGISLPHFASPLRAASVLFRLDQYWNMFAPFPLREDGWIVIPAKLLDGTEVDLFKEGKPVSWEKPSLISKMFKNDRWKAFVMSLYLDEENNETFLKHYAWYLIDQWNEKNPPKKHLHSFDIVFMLKTTSLEESLPLQKVILWHHDCFPVDEL